MHSTTRALLLLVVIAAVTRIAFGVFYAEPASYGDTYGYKRLATMLATGDLSDNDGFRTPLYPLLLWSCGSDQIVFVVQLLLGVLNTVLLFMAFHRLSESVLVGFLAGLLHAGNLSQLLHEGALLTETLSVFLFLAATVLLFRMLRQIPNVSSWSSMLLLGVVCACAVLTRPSSIVLPAAVVPFVLLQDRRAARLRGRSQWTLSLAFVAPVALLVAGWMTVNARTAGTFAISTLTGANLTHWSGDYMESAPEEFATVRDIYIAHRDRVGTSQQTIWKALPEIRQTTGLSFAQISADFRTMSLEIIREHPLAYAATVLKSGVLFWKPFLNSERHGLPESLVVVWKALLVLGGALFLAAPVVVLAVSRWRPAGPLAAGLVFLYALVLGSDLLQALFISVENARYSNVVDPLILGTAVLWCVAVLRRGPSGAEVRS